MVVCMGEWIRRKYGVGWKGREVGLGGMGGELVWGGGEEMSEFKVGDGVKVGKEMGGLGGRKGMECGWEGIGLVGSIKGDERVELLRGRMRKGYVEMMLEGVGKGEIGFRLKLRGGCEKEGKMVGEMMGMLKMEM